MAVTAGAGDTHRNRARRGDKREAWQRAGLAQRNRAGRRAREMGFDPSEREGEVGRERNTAHEAFWDFN